MSPDLKEEAGGFVPPVIPLEIEYQYLKNAKNQGWRDRALCKGRHDLIPDFYTENLSRNRTRIMVVEQVKREWCDNCSVRRECFHFAKSNEMIHGIWGGIDFTIPRDGRKHPIPDDID